MAGLHEDLIVIDGLIVSRWSPAVFQDMRRGGLTAAMERAGWPVAKITGVMGGNWQRVLKEVWGR